MGDMDDAIWILIIASLCLSLVCICIILFA